jgi:hypothetical protein
MSRENTMRLSRTVSTLLAVLLAATLSAAFVAPSQARVGAPSSHRLMKPNHDLHAAATEVGNDHFVIYGTLTTAPRVGIYRSTGGGTFYLYRKVKVNANGRFRTRVYQYKNYRTCFRVGVPETADYDQVIKAVGCIVSH